MEGRSWFRRPRPSWPIATGRKERVTRFELLINFYKKDSAQKCDKDNNSNSIVSIKAE
jgi:hypothetical protein